MAVNDELGKRMKEFYEQVPKTRLIRRTPVAIRVDGKAFHSFTRGFQKPFDEVLVKSMQDTMKYLCENVQGCVLGYTQSDEITLILVDYKKLTSSAFFDYEVQKICSVVASMATLEFNRKFEHYSFEWWSEKHSDPNFDEKYGSVYKAYLKSKDIGAMFDARCFNIPKEEVCNLIYWRQLDATRNSIQMVGQANFSHKELQNKSCNQIQDMLMLERGINWNDLPTYQKRGSCCIKSEVTATFANEDNEGNVVTGAIERPHWFIDNNIPIFRGEDREYIDKLIRFDDGCPCKIFIN